MPRWKVCVALGRIAWVTSGALYSTALAVLHTDCEVGSESTEVQHLQGKKRKHR